MNSSVHRELWTSWASLLRSYGAAHGLNSAVQAMVEVSAEMILLRAGARWVRFTKDSVETSAGGREGFAILEDGTVRVGAGEREEMDFAAERMMRELLM